MFPFHFRLHYILQLLGIALFVLPSNLLMAENSVMQGTGKFTGNFTVGDTTGERSITLNATPDASSTPTPTPRNLNIYTASGSIYSRYNDCTASLWSDGYLWLLTGPDSTSTQNMFFDTGGTFCWRNRSSVNQMTLAASSGNLQFNGNLTVSGNNIAGSGTNGNVLTFSYETAKATKDAEIGRILYIDPVATQPSAVSGKGLIYAITSTGVTKVFCRDSGGSNNQISSHFDPRDVDPKAITSFADAGVPLPYSLHHENTLLGVGQVVDLSKMYMYVQDKMQKELGEDQGKIVFNYNLPQSGCETVDQYNQAKIDAVAREVLNQLSAMDWIPVPLGVSEQIPAEVVQVIDETQTEMQNVQETKKEMDFDSMKVIEVTRTVVKAVEVPTGKKIKKLADGYRFENGIILRKPTINDVDMTKLAGSADEIPQYIIDRLKSKQVSLSQKRNITRDDILKALQTPKSNVQDASLQ